MPRRKTVRSGFGYTLIEILVGLVIIGILFGAGIISYRDFSRRQVLASTARQVRGDLKLAQEYALSGEKPDETCTLYGYRVKFTSDSYGIYSVCGPEEAVENKDDIVLPPGISLAASKTSVTFLVLGQGTDLTASDELSLVLTQEATGNTVTILVSSTGKIE